MTAAMWMWAAGLVIFAILCVVLADALYRGARDAYRDARMNEPSAKGRPRVRNRKPDGDHWDV